MNTREELSERLKENSRVLNSKMIENVFSEIDRADFVGEDYQAEAYGDYPLSIGFGQTISQPTTVAFMLRLLEPKPGERILDVGSGSGWTTALLSKLVGERGAVTGVEIVPGLVELGQRNIAKYKLKNTQIYQAGKNLGHKTPELYDKILVSAGAREVPDAFLAQLRVGGKMVIPVGQGLQSVILIEKVGDNEIKKKEFPGFAFVPLIY